MNIQAEKYLLDSYLWHAAKILDIKPKEVRERIREACDRSRKFYRWFENEHSRIMSNHEGALRLGFLGYSDEIERSVARLERLGLKQENEHD